MNCYLESEMRLRAALDGVDVRVVHETGSTNSDLRAEAGSITRPTLLVAGRQTGGRGRQGKHFLSPEGGLYMTLALPCSLPLTEAVGVTCCAAVAVHDAIRDTTGADCGIKWVNDLYLAGGKVAGILVEAVNDYATMMTRLLLIGIGVNLTTAPVLTDGTIRAVSLADCGYPCDRDALCVAIVRALCAMQDRRFAFSAVAERYRAHSIVLGQVLTFLENGIARDGVAVGIDDTGALLVDCGGKTHTLASGEISLRLR